VNFSFTDEQQQLRRSIREFAEGEIAPHVMVWDEASRFPVEIIPKLAQMGLLGVLFPEEYGGAGLGYIEYVIAIEELSRVDWLRRHHCRRAQLALFQPHLQIRHRSPKAEISHPAGPRQKNRRLVAHRTRSRSDAGGTRTTAKRDGGHWLINGAKTFTTNGHYADICVAMAVTDKAKNSHGISAFIVEKGTPGFRPGKKENKLGLRASDTSEMILSDCRVPQENLLGAEGEGFIGSLKILDGGRISIAALALGMAQGALDAAIKYAKQRKQFGQA
jgi:alkylation response protein AidB-like acyl-CoA dehydrogenase